MSLMISHIHHLQALGQTILHHLGTVAFGSLIVAVIRTIRAVVSYFQRKLKKTHNKLAEYLLCCVQCCLGCLERCIRFINKHAYIITAIYAYPFCTATRKAFWLLLRNVLRVSAVNLVATFVLIIGRVRCFHRCFCRIPVLTLRAFCWLLCRSSLPR
jgi:choline transporter-like protein 2/4/5